MTSFRPRNCLPSYYSIPHEPLPDVPGGPVARACLYGDGVEESKTPLVLTRDECFTADNVQGGSILFKAGDGGTRGIPLALLAVACPPHEGNIHFFIGDAVNPALELTPGGACMHGEQLTDSRQAFDDFWRFTSLWAIGTAKGPSGDQLYRTGAAPAGGTPGAINFHAADGGHMLTLSSHGAHTGSSYRRAYTRDAFITFLHWLDVAMLRVAP